MMNVWLMVMLALALLGCRGSAPRQGERLEPIRVAYTVQPQSVLIHVALANGYFREEGLQVESVLRTFGKASLQALLDHQAEFATVAETPVMFSILKGEKIFVITNIEASTKNNAIAARRDAGINRPADLQGKRIAFTPGTTSDFFLDSLLTALGLNRGDIKPVPMNPEEMPDALLGGQVDAVCTWNYPLAKVKRRLGSNGVVFFDEDIYTETYNVAAQQDFVRSHPETVQRFLRALVKAETFVAKAPGQAQAIMAARTGTDLALVQEVWSAFNYRLQLGPNLVITLEDETRWAMRNHLAEPKAMPDYRQFLYLDALRAVRPKAVTDRR